MFHMVLNIEQDKVFTQTNCKKYYTVLVVYEQSLVPGFWSFL